MATVGISYQARIRDLLVESYRKVGQSGDNVPSENAIEADSIGACLRNLVDVIPEADFFRLYCATWRIFEYNVLSHCRVGEANICAARFAQLAEKPNSVPEFTHDVVRAMCLSFLVNDLDSRPEAQAYVLRMFMLFAIEAKLCSNGKFTAWMLSFLKRRLTFMLSIQEKRRVFIEVSVDFFSSIPQELYDMNCVTSVLSFFAAKLCKECCARPNESMTVRIREVATKTLTAAMSLESEFFLCEILKDTPYLARHLTEAQSEVVNVFVDGTVADFDKIAETNEFIKTCGVSVDTMRFKMRVLTFVSLVHDKSEVPFADVLTFGLDLMQLKRLVVAINQTDVADVDINSVEKKLVIEFCQPRHFTTKVWRDMGVRLQHLKESVTSRSDVI